MFLMLLMWFKKLNIDSFLDTRYSLTLMTLNYVIKFLVYNNLQAAADCRIKYFLVRSMDGLYSWINFSSRQVPTVSPGEK